MKRAALSLATTIGAFLAFGPATAWAEGETILSYSGSPTAGSSITVTAAPGRANSVHAVLDITGYFQFRDTSAGLTESPDTPYCNQFSSTEVRCMNEGLSSVSIFSGDGDDALAINDTTEANIEFHIFTGTGNDTFNARLPCDTEGGNSGSALLGSGNDITNISGCARVSGGGGKDKLRGGKGNQKLFGGANPDRISCGKGKKDLGNGGGGDDQIADNCERVVNP